MLPSRNWRGNNMPRYKLTNKERRMMAQIKSAAPCLKISVLAKIFEISPSRASEILRDAKKEKTNG